VNVAIGLAASQLRYVEGLPPVTESRVITEIVTRGSSRFLFQRGGPVIITGVRIAKPGAAWVGAVDESLTREVIEACRANGIGVTLVLPTLVALWRGAAGNHLVWRDGGVVAEMTFAAHGVEHARWRTARGNEEDLSRLTPGSELATLGDAAWTYADAYGAAVVRNEPLAFPAGTLAEQTRIRPWRLTLAVAACVLCLTGATILPTIIVGRSAARAEARVAQLGNARRETARLQRDQHTLAEALSEVSAFASSRRSPTQLLAGLTDALPENAVLVAFQVDSTGGSIVGAGSHAAEIVNGVERVPGIVAPQIAGAITRGVIGSQELERVNVRFSLTAGSDNAGTRRESRVRLTDHSIQR
jgi:hypothetical protein